MRLDRFITLGLVHPCRQAFGASAGSGPGSVIPILMYHSISEKSEPEVGAYYQVNTPPEVFRKHLRLLTESNYQTVTLSAAMESLRSDAAASRTGSTVVITFDDGFQDFHTHAFPALREHGFTATMFLPTGSIGAERRSFKGRPCLTWEEVRALRKEGVEFGSHTVNHPVLVDLPEDQVRRELRESREKLEQELSERITTFCYPYAYPQGRPQFTQFFTREVAAAGYTCCATTRVGRAKTGEDPFCLKRLPVNGQDDAALLRAKLEGAYDWLETPQRAAKQVKAWFRP